MGVVTLTGARTPEGHPEPGASAAIPVRVDPEGVAKLGLFVSHGLLEFHVPRDLTVEQPPRSTLSTLITRAIPVSIVTPGVLVRPRRWPSGRLPEGDPEGDDCDGPAGHGDVIGMMGFPVLEALPCRGAPYELTDPFILVHEGRLRSSERAGVDTRHPPPRLRQPVVRDPGSASTGHSTGPGGSFEVVAVCPFVRG